MDLLRTSTTDTAGDPVWEVILNGNVTFSTTASDILDFDKKVQANLTQLQIDAGQGTTTPPVNPPPVTPPPPATGFRGIFAFNTMSNTALFSDNPNVAGTTLTYYWAQLEPQPGVFNWAIIDNDMKPWVAAGKSVILRVSASGQYKWQPPQSGSGTPKWVYDQGVPSVTETDKSVIPQYWNTTFLQDLNTFVEALASRYDGNAHVSAIEIGIGMGGETKPDTEKGANVLKLWQTIGYTDANWWTAIQKIIDMYVGAFKTTPLALMPDASFLQGGSGYDEAKVVNYAASHNVWMQWNGLTAGASLPGSFSSLKKPYPMILEQLNAAGANKRSLANDIQTAVSLGALAVLVFTSDLQDPANAPTLAKYAALVGK